MQRISLEVAKLADLIFPNQAVELDYTIEDDDGKVYFVPYQAELQEWLRNEHNIHVEVFFIKPRHKKSHIKPIADNTSWGAGWIDITTESVMLEDIHYKETYEEALEEALQKALKTIV